MFKNHVETIEKEGHQGRVIWPIEKVWNIPQIEKPEGAVTAVFLDTETTGLDSSKCEIIELAMLEVFLKKEGESYKIVGTGREFNQLQQPKNPLEEVITQVTGLTDEDLKGQSIDWTEAKEIYQGAQLIVAHNAAFDYGFCKDVLFDKNDKKIWVCSIKDMNWKDEGFLSSKQESLCLENGFYYSAHRALGDVKALAMLLSYGDNINNLIVNSKESGVIACAIGADFSAKDALRERGYAWNPNGEKCWYKKIPKTEMEAEQEWLRKNCYRKAGRSLARMIAVNPATRMENIANLL